MKPQISNQQEKKQKQIKPQQNKAEEKTKEKKNNIYPSTNNKNNNNILLRNNSKTLKNKNLTDLTKENPQQKRVFSVSQEKDRDNIGGIGLDKKNKKKPRNLSMDRNIKTKQDFMKTPGNIKINYNTNKKTSNDNKKSDNKKGKKNEVDELSQNYDPNLYGFNLYKHIKENLRNKDRLCKDKLTKNSYYCLDCKLSTCKKCLLYHTHDGHNLVQKYPYYESHQKIIKDAFNEIDTFLEKNNDSLNSQKMKEELKKTVDDSITKITKRLNEVKNNKLKELDKLFENTDGCLDTLKEKKDKIKNDIRQYLTKQKTFYYINVAADEDQIEKEAMNDPDYDVLKNLNKNVNKNAGMIESNNDTYNSTFLITYDLLKNSIYLNKRICDLLNDIKANKEKYLKELNENITQINEDIDKLNKPFEGLFNFNYLTNEFYTMVSDKINKYNEKIDSMRKYIFDMTNKFGTFEAIDKDNKVAETHVKQRFDNILNNQLSGQDMDKEEISRKQTLKGYKALPRLSMYLNAGVPNAKLRNSLNSMSNGSIANDNAKNEKKRNSIYDKPEEIKLDKEILQKYYAYESYNVIHNNFRYKKPKSEEEMIEELDDEIDVAKPIPGTNEMLLFDRKTTVLTKKEVLFDKKKHKYLCFLNGCRSVLVKDMLYIFGGVDQDKNPTKVAYVYYTKTNELKVMPEMLSPHAYHSVAFLDYYRAIIVIGGENSAACEIYDLKTGLWKELPEMNVPRAHCNVYLDKITHIIYTFFGVVGDITEKNNYVDVIECMELRRLALGWSIIDYENKAEMDFKSGYNKIFPLSTEMILIYGATNMRDFVKKAAVYLIPKLEIVKIDNNIFKEIKEQSKFSRKLSKILSTYI